MGVAVEADDVTARPDALGHQPHRFARSASDIQAACAGWQIDAVEERLGRRLPDASLLPEPFVLLGWCGP